MHVERPDERGQPESSLVAGGVHRVQVAAAGLDDVQRHGRDRSVHGVEQLDRRLLRPPRPVVAHHPEPVHQLVEPGARAQLQQPYAVTTRRRREIEHPDQQRDRATDLVGLRRDRQRLVQLGGVCRDHPPHHRPGRRRRLDPAEAGVVGHAAPAPGRSARAGRSRRAGAAGSPRRAEPPRSRAPPAASGPPDSRSSAIPRSTYPYRWVCSPAWARNRWARVCPDRSRPSTLRPSRAPFYRGDRWPARRPREAAGDLRQQGDLRAATGHCRRTRATGSRRPRRRRRPAGSGPPRRPPRPAAGATPAGRASP